MKVVRDSRPRSSFLPLWTLATVATVAAFVVHLALRGKTMSLGYEIGRARAEQARLQDVRRVLQLEAASYKNPERVGVVAHGLLGMETPSADRIVVLSSHAERAPWPHKDGGAGVEGRRESAGGLHADAGGAPSPARQGPP